MVTDINSARNKSRKPGKKSGNGKADEVKEPKRVRAPRSKTPELFSDLHPERIEEIERQADIVQDCQENRQAWTKKETAARDLLLKLLEQHGRKTYKYDGKVTGIEEGAKKAFVRKEKKKKEKVAKSGR